MQKKANKSLKTGITNNIMKNVSCETTGLDINCSQSTSPNSNRNNQEILKTANSLSRIEEIITSLINKAVKGTGVSKANKVRMANAFVNAIKQDENLSMALVTAVSSNNTTMLNYISEIITDATRSFLNKYNGRINKMTHEVVKMSNHHGMASSKSHSKIVSKKTNKVKVTKVVSKAKKATSKVNHKISTTADLTKAVVHFLHDNHQLIQKFAQKMNSKHTQAEQLAGLIVGLITNAKLLSEKGQHSLQTILNAAFSIGKVAKAAPKAKKAVAKKAAPKKAKKAVAKKAAPKAKKAVAKKAAPKKAKKAVAKKAAPKAKKAVAKKVAPKAKKAVAKKAAPKAKKVVAKKVAPKAKKAVAKKVAPKAKKAVAKKAAPKAKKVVAKKVAPKAKKVVAKKVAPKAKKAVAKKVAPKAKKAVAVKKTASKIKAAISKKPAMSHKAHQPAVKSAVAK